jgi:hypothetical protein
MYRGIVFLILSVTNFSYANQLYASGLNEKNMVTSNEKRLYELVSNYISDKKGWPNESYRIEQKEKKDNILIYWVIYKEDEKNLYLGGGQSVELHVDSSDMKIIKELAFQ